MSGQEQAWAAYQEAANVHVGQAIRPEFAREAFEAGYRAALESSVQAPAVDREALARLCVSEVERLMPDNQHAGDLGDAVGTAVFAHLFASGVLQDAAEVEARGLEKAAGIINAVVLVNGGSVKDSNEVALIAVEAVTARAQQVREGNA